jgi:hypothetical protein
MHPAMMEKPLKRDMAIKKRTLSMMLESTICVMEFPTMKGPPSGLVWLNLTAMNVPCPPRNRLFGILKGF